MPITWTARVWAEFRADNLTRAYRDVLLTLATYRGTGGVAWPSHATLAERAGCCVRTVGRALDIARRVGLVSWTERRVRARWRWLRTSNLYRLLAPAEPVTAGQRFAWSRGRATTGQNGGGGESQGKRGLLKVMLEEAARAPDLLALRRAEMARRLAR